MASPGGNSGNPSQFDMSRLFKPQTPGMVSNSGSGSVAASPSHFLPLSSFPTPQPAYSSPSLHAFSLPPPTPPFPNHPFLQYPQDSLRPPLPFSSAHSPQLLNPNPNPSQAPAQNHGARLMALLGTVSTSAGLESASSMPIPSSDFLPSSSILYPIPSAPPVMAAPLAVAQAAPARNLSSKMPRGRRFARGDRVVYDVEMRLPGESEPPQLEVAPITKYISDPGLVLGRQIAVNKTYIVYGLRQGAIRIININTALRTLLRWHSQRVTDLAFFTEDVHLIASASMEGRIYVWKIEEDPDNEEKPQIEGKINFALQMVGGGEWYHPRVCWHSHKQEILFVGIGQHVLKIDATKVGRGIEFNVEMPLMCPLENLIDGVQLIGKHDDDITDLSISQWMTTRLVSASKDGVIKIWDDRKSAPLTVLKPHDGQPVNSVAFLTAPNRPNHIILLTAGPLNQEMKLWASSAEEGYPLPSDSESWRCIQTLDLISSSEPRLEDAFFNQIVVLPQASFILLANAKKNTIYAVHLDYGSCPAATRMDSIADFTVAMPILSLTGILDIFAEGEPIIQIYCVQTQAIQQYALDLSQCFPPPFENAGSGKDSLTTRVSDTTTVEGFVVVEPSLMFSGLPSGIVFSKAGTSNVETIAAVVQTSVMDPSEIINFPEVTAYKMDQNASVPLLLGPDAGVSGASSFSISSSDHLGQSSAVVGSSKGLGRIASPETDMDSTVLDQEVLIRADNATVDYSDVYGFDESEGKAEIVVSSNEKSFSTPVADLTHDSQGLKGDAGVLDDYLTKTQRNVDIEKCNDSLSAVENKDESFNSLNILDNIVMSSVETFILEGAGSTTLESSVEAVEQQPSNIEEFSQYSTKDAYETVSETAFDTASLSPAVYKEKQKGKQSSASPPPSSPLNSIDSLNEHEKGIESSVCLSDSTPSQIQALQSSLNQVMIMQKEMQKNLTAMILSPITKEGKRLEASLGRSTEKIVKANVEALWARFQEESAKQDKASRDRMQQLTNFITNCINKDLPSLLEKALKKEISATVPVLARTVASSMEKTIASAVQDAFQRCVADKSINQLEKTVSSKLEATVVRQIQSQFQTSGKQALQDGLRSAMESSVVPAFELLCKAMFGQVDAALQKGIIEHASAAQQQIESTNTSLALTLRDAINSASSLTQNLTNDLVDGQRQILALIAAGNATASNVLAGNEINGPLGRARNLVDAPVDPIKDLTRLISDRKYEEAFTLALQRNDLALVSWLCSQVDLHAICNMTPPLGQGVLLALLQQLACDIGKDTPRKLGWMTDVAAAIDPQSPVIALHVRPIFEQVYSILTHQRSISAAAPESATIRLLMHVVNSMLMSCK